MLVRCVRSAALRAEAVEHRDPEGADDVSVGAAARRRLLQVEAELEAVLSGLREQCRGTGGRLERRPRPAAADLQ